MAVLALGGTLSVGEYLAGAVIALMLATGRELEARASARARRELSALLARAPSVVHRVEGDTLTTQSVDIVRPGDVLIVAPGELVPVDGQLVSNSAMFDESALTGETALVERAAGDAVRSGGVNAGGAFRLRTTATAE
jgi:P-type E1-E2 ATPase